MRYPFTVNLTTVWLISHDVSIWVGWLVGVGCLINALTRKIYIRWTVDTKAFTADAFTLSSVIVKDGRHGIQKWGKVVFFGEGRIFLFVDGRATANNCLFQKSNLTKDTIGPLSGYIETAS